MIKALLPLFVFLVLALPAHAQTEPLVACDELPDGGAVYNEVTEQWEYPTNCIGDVVTVTATDGMSFKEFIYEDLIPFIDGFVIQALYAIAILFFIFGMFKFFFTGGEGNRQKGRQFAVWSLIALVVLFSVWSLVRILLGSIFPAEQWGSRDVGNVPPGGQCSSGVQCRTGVCTKRGIYTSTCE